jgi:solute carrier family 25 (mitochondrial citrate transporter), member 1
LHGVRTIAAQEGLSGLYRGVTAVVARQGANSAVRMTTYGFLKEETAQRFGVGKLPWYINFVNGNAQITSLRQSALFLCILVFIVDLT